MGGPTRPCAKVLLKYARSGKVEMLIPNYTKWSGMSCGGKDHDELWSGKRRSFGEINKMVIFREKRLLKRDFLPFSTNIYFRKKKHFKRDFLQRPIYGKKI